MLDGSRAVLRTIAALVLSAGLIGAPAAASALPVSAATSADAGPSDSAPATSASPSEAGAATVSAPAPTTTPQATPGADSAGVAPSPEAGAYFGTTIDWSVDTAVREAERLGEVPAVLEHVTRFPVSSLERTYLAQFVVQAARVGALPAVTIAPEGSLAGFDEADAADIVDAIAAARPDPAIPVYVRFAPSMNAPWVAWGQDPDAYVTAFRLMADAVHRDLPGAVTVWSPAAGEGYPFDSSVDRDTLDTDGEGRAGEGDDPYGPYYPSDRYADWVGLVAYHDPSVGEDAVNAVPAEDALARMLDGDGVLAFADRFASADSPLMLETGAFYSDGAGGDAELDIKRAWWRQVVAAAGELPVLDAVLWRDAASSRGAAGLAPVEWGITRSDDLVDAFVADATGSALVFGPVYAPSAGGDGPAGLAAGTTLSGAAGWTVAALVLAGAIALLVWGMTKGRRSRLRYDGPAHRDLRIDLMRGIAIVFVLVNHVGLVSISQNATQEAVGMVSGAEFFVLLSGVLLAMVYRPKIVRDGMASAAGLIERRAWKIYVASLCVVLAIGLLSLIPFLDSSPVTSFADEGTGAAGAQATGRVYDLYAGWDRLLQYPVDPGVFADILLLRMGPWQVNVLGFYVVMLAVSPLILWALSRGRAWWIVVLTASWVVYGIQSALHLRLLPSQFEDSFPLLSWQALFVTGMVAGYHRNAIVAWFGTTVGRVVLALCVIATATLTIMSWNNPYLSSSLDVRLGLLPQNAFSAIYADWFERTYLDPGRVLNVLLLTVTVYALFTVLWKPLDRAVGWFFIPLGQTTLYVFIMQLVFVLIVANIPFLHRGDLLVNSLAYVVILGLMWVMVKKRFLFAIVPR